MTRITDVGAEQLLDKISIRIICKAAAEYGLKRNDLKIEVVKRNYLSRKLAFVYCQYLHSALESHGKEKIFNSNIGWKEIKNAIGFWEIPSFKQDIADQCQLKYFSFSDRMFVPIYWEGNFMNLDAYQCLALKSVDPNSHLVDPNSRQDCITQLGYKLFTDALIAAQLPLPKLSVSFNK